MSEKKTLPEDYTDRCKSRASLLIEAEVAEKYFKHVEITHEGILKFAKGSYIYRKGYGYAYVPGHKKVVKRFTSLTELEEWFKEMSEKTESKDSVSEEKAVYGVKDKLLKMGIVYYYF